MSRSGIKGSRLGIVLLGTLVIAGFGVGCQSSTKQVAAFGKAAGDLTRNAGEAYAQLDETTVQRKIFSVASDPGTLPNDRTFEGMLRADQYALKMKLLKNLGDYATALGTLSTADFRKDVASASKDLYGSLSGLNGTYTEIKGGDPPISEASLKLFATAVDAIGTYMVEKKRRDAIRTIVIGVNDGVQSASQLLAKELPGIGGFVELNLSTVETDLIADYKHNAAKMSLQKRVAVLERIRIVNRAKREAVPLFDRLGGGANKLGEAHAKLEAAVKSGDLTSGDLIAAIGELKDDADAVMAFRKSLNK